ncbi:WecB/TagA/CpsF family glycosyltransferase [Actinopolymorpha rutila]|uniref:N-acetylglucosaminyldiphosphoundecaprenol N-acetyl-beta-D-mannosaminyltransferase n=1 Tax=Actinopolymorpha rutila TaxID=446787 RepID=A0A852Z454_9ACTN|nr:WecB/TagA/CpsF family glycosyltransferase [Actinopolymorpha rutila]NYH87601.1 N-acetylglucosaminyldiphosphoundecaprenol N-acetyl-beta-D-mannosaminyltransferase [Actinopolymorpha rutila]
MAVTSVSRRLRVLGVPVDAVDMQGTLNWVEERVASRKSGTHLCVNAANVVRAHDDPDYLAVLERGDLIGSDGQPFVWAARALGQPLPERVAGIDLMEQVLDRSRETGWRVYLLGGRDEVVRRLAGQLSARGVRIVGHRDGYFGPDDASRVWDEVRSADPDVVFVGMPTPTKEHFIIEGAHQAQVPVCIGVGGSFDVLAGDLRRAPAYMQRLGLEWLFRLLQEPRRLFTRYAVTNTRFLALVLRAMVRRTRTARG